MILLMNQSAPSVRALSGGGFGSVKVSKPWRSSQYVFLIGEKIESLKYEPAPLNCRVVVTDDESAGQGLFLRPEQKCAV